MGPTICYGQLFLQYVYELERVLKYRLDPANHRVVCHLFRPRQHILDI